MDQGVKVKISFIWEYLSKPTLCQSFKLVYQAYKKITLRVGTNHQLSEWTFNFIKRSFF